MDRRQTKEALRLLDSHQPFVRASVVRATGSVPGKLGASMIVRADGSTMGTVGGAALEEEVKNLSRDIFTSRTGDLRHFDLQAWTPGGLPSLCGGSVDIALEFVAARPNLLLWGGGHVAHALASLLPTLEYDYSVADDRAEWIGAERFPTADRREVVAPEKVWEVFEPASFTHVYLLGYDALRDLEALAASIARFPNVIGLIASSAKREHMYAKLRDRGISREALARVRSPVGLDIGAETPAEIAVSIVSEIVAERHPTILGTSARDIRASVESKSVVSRSA
jgi:xanthine dehydrogenase accessory factor